MKQAVFLLSLALAMYFCSVSVKEKKKHEESTSSQNEANQELADSIKLIGRSFEDRQGITYSSIQSVSVDLNSDGNMDTLHIQKAVGSINPRDSAYYAWTDPGDFHRIIVSITGGKESTITNIGGWLENKDLAYYDESFNKYNLVESAFITVRDPNNGSKLIFCGGYPYASEPGLLTITEIINHEPKLIFNLNTYLFKFEDFNGDEILDIATTVWDKYDLEDQNKVDFKVYLLNHEFTFSEEYSQKLNNQF